MPKKITAAPGSWESNINSRFVVNGAPRISDLLLTDSGAYWLESVASEQGRSAIFRYHEGKIRNILPRNYNVRSKVHEYGGGALCVKGDTAFFVNSEDQQIYALSLITPHSVRQITQDYSSRFADLYWDEHAQSVLAVKEQHLPDAECKNSVVRIALNGQSVTLAEGEDFYAYPRPSPSGHYYSWISWSHPNMPWDRSRLHIVSRNNEPILCLGDAHPQSISQATWGQNDTLYFVSDINDWWNIYTIKAHTTSTEQDLVAVYPKEAEFATPQWTFAMQHFQAINDHDIVAAYTCDGFWHLDIIDTKNRTVRPLINKTAWIDSVCVHNDHIACIETRVDTPASVRLFNRETKKRIAVHTPPEPCKNELSTPQSFYFQGKDGHRSQAFFYPAHNSRYESREAQPLIVLAHGGPTGQTSAGLNYKIQYWTNRGFAVVDVNYRGSTGFGKAYRDALHKQWGVADVDDLVSAVNALIENENIDANKIIIKGSSAGGFSVLAALTFTPRFNAGVCLYGIGDLELLAKDTHKFEKHYLDTLIGAYPQEKAIYLARSPIHHTQKLDCALLLFQGLEDKVVPPNQAQIMAAAVATKGLMVELIEYPDEGHGFRNPKNIVHMLDSELAFYQRVFSLNH